MAGFGSARVWAGRSPRSEATFLSNAHESCASSVEMSVPRAPFQTALTAWISSADAFCASPYNMRVLSR
jgi:hypothetical protein